VFLRDKQEASGFPTWCIDAHSNQTYIDDYYKHQGIRLRVEHIEDNPARRMLAKLCLNSLWGKFAQRVNLSQTNIITDPTVLHAYLFDNAYVINSCTFIDDETACLCWQYATEYPTVADNINIFIAVFTTVHARLKLYQVLEPLQERVLYMDTDSIIFVSSPGEVDPPTGDYLGDLTSELAPDEYIVEFLSAGPKTYGYHTSLGTVVMKVKGITLNVNNNVAINFDSLKDLVQSYAEGPRGEDADSIVVTQPSIVRDKKRWQINTNTLQKTLRVVFDKRVLSPNGLTYPYGY
jgi:hypothetical protein